MRPQPPRYVRDIIVFLALIFVPVIVVEIIDISENTLLRIVPLLAILAFFVPFMMILLLPDFTRKWTNYIAFCVGTIIWFLLPDTIASEKFYELTVQVAPVLFVALALETRTYRYQVSHTATFSDIASVWFVAMPAIALVVAGFESLRAISLGQPERGTFDIVAGALAAAAVSLFFTAVLGPYSRTETELPHNEQEP